MLRKFQDWAKILLTKERILSYKILREFSTGVVKVNEVFWCLCILHPIYLCTKFHVCGVGYPLTLYFLLFTKIYVYLLSFQAYMELLNFTFMSMRRTLEPKNFC